MSQSPSSSLPAEPGRNVSGPVGILLVNLGTPAAPTPAAIRRYLGEFLSDPRVIEIPRLVWLPILHGIVLRRRPGKIAPRYASIWMEGGSPLLVYSRRQAEGVQALLAGRGLSAKVALGMRYGEPSIASALDALRAQGCERILTLPLYPQYSASTTATVVDEIGRLMRRLRNQPELRFVKRFHTDPGYIGALAASIRAHWQANGEPDKLLMSFHGLPQRCVDLGDPYAGDCADTARALAERLGLPQERWVMTFQSRFGAARWLEPYTEPTLRELGRTGVRRVDVVCPGFPADCIETLEEIDQECREAFLSEGGEQFRYIPALNDNAIWVAALADLAERHIQGWERRAS